MFSLIDPPMSPGSKKMLEEMKSCCPEIAMEFRRLHRRGVFDENVPHQRGLTSYYDYLDSLDELEDDEGAEENPGGQNHNDHNLSSPQTSSTAVLETNTRVFSSFTELYMSL